MEHDASSDRYAGNPRQSFSVYIGAGLDRGIEFERVGLFDSELQKTPIGSIVHTRQI